MIEKERYAPLKVWEETLERENSVRISRVTIKKRLEEAGFEGVDGLDRGGRYLRRGFFSESAIRKSCADLLEDLPQAGQDDLIHMDGEVYGTTRRLGSYLGTSMGKVQRRIAHFSPKSIRGKDRLGHICNFYSVSEIRALCEKKLSSDEEGESTASETAQEEVETATSQLAVIDGVTYRSVKDLAELFGLAQGTLRNRIRKQDLSPIRGWKGTKLFSEDEVRACCSDLLEDCPQADECGLIQIDGEIYGTASSLSRYLGFSVEKQVTKKPIKCITGKDHGGKISTFYQASEVAKIYHEPRRNVPKANNDGIIVQGGEVYRTCFSWAKIFGIGKTTIRRMIDEAGPQPIQGLSSSNRVTAFYPETGIRLICQDLVALPRADEDGFIVHQGQCYGSISGLFRRLGVSHRILLQKIQENGLTPVRGRDARGRRFDFYSEAEVRLICQDHLTTVLQTDEDGFTTHQGQRYGTLRALADLCQLNRQTLSQKISRSNPASIIAMDSGNRVRTLYSETDVKQVCQDHLASVPKADEEGFIYLNDKRHGTIPGLRKLLGVSCSGIRNKIKEHSLPFIKGKNASGMITAFYSVSEVRRIIHKRKKK